MAAVARGAALEDELAGYFGPESMTWRIGGELALLLGGGRAVLMQLAHPLVATGVGHHSAWSSDPWGRTFKTVELTQAIAFGTRAEARASARFINQLHMDVTGTTSQAYGSFAAGTDYQARDPTLLLWVLATLVDTALQIYPLLVGPLSPSEQEQYYQEAKRSAHLLGMPEHVAPSNLAAFRVYMREMLAGDTLAMTPEARRVARVVMHMPAPFVLRPALLGAEQITVGLLPPRIRELYGYSWDRGRQALLDAWALGTRQVYPRLPPLLRRVPAARAASRRVRAARVGRAGDGLAS